MAISVKVVRVPGAVVEVALEDGATVGQALDAAQMSVNDGESLKVNAEAATHDTVLSNNDRVFLAKGAKGNL